MRQLPSLPYADSIVFPDAEYFLTQYANGDPTATASIALVRMSVLAHGGLRFQCSGLFDCQLGQALHVCEVTLRFPAAFAGYSQYHRRIDWHAFGDVVFSLPHVRFCSLTFETERDKLQFEKTHHAYFMNNTRFRLFVD